MMTFLQKLSVGFLSVILMLSALLTAHADTYAGMLPERTYDGRIYRARPAAELTTILLIGYDHFSEGETEELHGHSSGGQSDFLMIVVLDHKHQQIRRLQIDRDTMTGVRVTDSNGKQHDPMLLQICFAHAFGNTREKNNANTLWTVERLLSIGAPDDGAQIDWYMSMDISGISVLNDMLGGVTVTVPVDMTSLDPDMEEGAVIRLTGRQAHYFCRYRYGVGDQSNASRMVRQEIFMEAAGHLLKQKMKANPNYAQKLLDSMGVIYDQSVSEDDPFSYLSGYVSTPAGDVRGRYLMTNATRGRIIADISAAVDYELLPLETLEGVHSLGSNGFIRYDLNQDAALRWTLNVFYD